MPFTGQLPSQIWEILETKEVYPIGILAYYGPDDQTCTKIIASVINAPNARPHSRVWQAQGVCEDPLVAAEIGDFFRLSSVQDVVMTEGVVGCPHEEGIDFPQGEYCLECSFWQDPSGV